MVTVAFVVNAPPTLTAKGGLTVTFSAIAMIVKAVRNSSAFRSMETAAFVMVSFK